MKYSLVELKDLEADSHRLDSEYYQEIYLHAESTLKRRRWAYLEALIRDIKSFGAYSLCNQITYQDKGIPFLRGIDIKDGFADFSNVLRIDEQGHKLLWKSAVKPRTVLLTMSGSVGNAAFAMKDWDYPVNSSQDIAKITTSNEINPLYLTILLNSRYGKLQTRRLPVGSIQQHIFLWQLKKLIIPRLAEEFQNLAEKIYLQAFESLQNSKCLYAQAETLLLTELGLHNWQPRHHLAFEADFAAAQAADRFDAEYFQPKYDEIVLQVRRYVHGWAYLGDIVTLRDSNFSPKSDTTYKYIELSNISNFGEITGYTEATGDALPSRARRRVKTGDIVVSSIEGSLTSTALVTEEYNNALCSTGFYVIYSQSLNPATLLCLMKSSIGLQQLEKGCNGTILTAINKDEFKKVVLPKVSDNVQIEIDAMITQSYQARSQSKHLLDLAKTAVERAIEHDEAAATTWLRVQLAQLGMTDLI